MRHVSPRSCARRAKSRFWRHYVGSMCSATSNASRRGGVKQSREALERRTWTMSTYTATTVPTQFVEANGIRFAYRRWGNRSALPLAFNQHFTGNLDNWDPAVLDGLAKEREVIVFNNAGVAS